MKYQKEEVEELGLPSPTHCDSSHSVSTNFFLELNGSASNVGNAASHTVPLLDENIAQSSSSLHIPILAGHTSTRDLAGCVAEGVNTRKRTLHRQFDYVASEKSAANHLSAPFKPALCNIAQGESETVVKPSTSQLHLSSGVDSSCFEVTRGGQSPPPESPVAKRRDSVGSRTRLVANFIKLERFPSSTEGRDTSFFPDSLAGDQGEPRKTTTTTASSIPDPSASQYSSNTLNLVSDTTVSLSTLSSAFSGKQDTSHSKNDFSDDDLNALKLPATEGASSTRLRRTGIAEFDFGGEDTSSEHSTLEDSDTVSDETDSSVDPKELQEELKALREEEEEVIAYSGCIGRARYGYPWRPRGEELAAKYRGAGLPESAASVRLPKVSSVYNSVFDKQDSGAPVSQSYSRPLGEILRPKNSQSMMEKKADLNDPCQSDSGHSSPCAYPLLRRLSEAVNPRSRRQRASPDSDDEESALRTRSAVATEEESGDEECKNTRSPHTPPLSLLDHDFVSSSSCTTGFILTPSASPNRKKSRVLCSKREAHSIFSTEQAAVEGTDGHSGSPEESDPSVAFDDIGCVQRPLSGSVVASCGSDDDEHSTMNTLDEQPDDEDDDEQLMRQGLEHGSLLKQRKSGDDTEVDVGLSGPGDRATLLGTLRSAQENEDRRRGGALPPLLPAATATVATGYTESANCLSDEDRDDDNNDALSEPFSSSSSCSSVRQPQQLLLGEKSFLTNPSCNVSEKSRPTVPRSFGPTGVSPLSPSSNLCLSEQSNLLIEGAALREQHRVIHGDRDFSNCRNLPPPKENEIEFVIENFLSLREDPSSPDRVWSQPKTYQSVTFRVLVFPKGNKNMRLGNVSAYVAVDPSDAFPQRFKNMWYMHHCDYLLLAVNWRNWKDGSICKNEHFSFSADDVDRGWLEFIPQEGLKKGEFLGPSGQLVIRAQICPRAVVAGSQHILGRQDVGYIGIRNQGATCYLNSLVQALYHIGAFRKSVFQLTLEGDKAFATKSLSESGTATVDREKDLNSNAIDKLTEVGDDDAPWTENEMRQAFEEDEECDALLNPGCGGKLSSRLKVSLALQALFLKLSSSNEVVTTDDLIKSFGWESNESLTQHDAQELNRLLCDRLEEQMKGTPSEGVIEQLFMGEFENYVECIDVPYGSSRRETFYDLQLDVQNTNDIYESLNKYVEEEVLEGDNLYDAEQFGRQRARKGVRFIRFPPVIQFHLKRFTFDPSRMDMVKINQRFEYPQTLDLSKVLPGAGLYDLFCVIVHAGDVGGGHYYVMNRPGGNEWWMRFDDEKVYPVSPHSALNDSYGGRDAVCWDYVKHFDDPHYRPEEPSVKLHSAYILFYVQSDRSQELLEEPDPNKANPYLLQRRQWEEGSRQKQLQIQNYVRNCVKVRYITEVSLRGYKGFLNDLSSLPARLEGRYPRSMTMLDLWKTVDTQVARRELIDPLLSDTHETHYYGLWYFDAAVSRSSSRALDLRPLACHLSECPKREFTLGDHLNWVARSLRKVWAPTLSLLVHPLFTRRRPEVRSLGALQNTLSDSRFFIAKFFSPGRSTDPQSCDQSLVVAGLPVLKFPKDKRHTSPLILLFVELLRTLMDSPTTPIFDEPEIEEFVQKAIKLYIPQTGNGNRSVEDPLRVAERVYVEFGGMFEHLTGSPVSVLERIELSRHFRVDEWFPPVIVFALPPSIEALQMHSKAKLYSTSPGLVNVYEDDITYGKSTMVDYSVKCEAQGGSSSPAPDDRGPGSGELKLPDGVPKEPADDSRVAVCDMSPCAWKRNSKQQDETDDMSLLPVAELQAFDGSCPTPFLPARRYPPSVPRYPSCTPVDWHAALTRSKILVTLKLYDPIATLSRWEDASGHPVGLDTSGPELMLGNSAITSSLAEDPVALKEFVDKKLESASDSFQRLTTGDVESTLRLRCPPIKEVKVEVDLRWPYRLALRWLCWHLGVDADYCIVQPVPPLSVSEAPAFTTRLSPAEAEYLTSLLSWNVGRSHYSTPATATTTAATPVSQCSESCSRLEDLHSYFLQRQGITRFREVTYPADEVFESGVQYHLSILPRPLTDASLGFVPPTAKDTAAGKILSEVDNGRRLVLVRVFNEKVENVGCVLVDLNKDEPPTVVEFVEKAKALFTSTMQLRGAHKHLRYRLVWTGVPYADPSGIQQTNVLLSRLDVVNDQLLAARLPLLARGFQFGSPLRLEPDFSDAQIRDLTVSESLSPVMSLPEQVAVPRALCLTVLHQNRDRQYFGHPFFIIVSSCDTLKTMKEKIQAKLGFADAPFGKWKFFVYDYEHTSFLKDDEVPDFSRGRPPCLLAVHRNLYAPEEKSRALQLHIK